MTQVSVKSRNVSRGAPDALKEILRELRLLRSEVALFLPYEDINGYAHPDRIRRSYGRAIKNYPPRSV